MRTGSMVIASALERLLDARHADVMRACIEESLEDVYKNILYKDGLMHIDSPYPQFESTHPYKIWARCISTAAKNDIDKLKDGAYVEWCDLLSRGRTAWCVLVTNTMGDDLRDVCRVADKPVVELVEWDKKAGRYKYEFRDAKKKYVEVTYREVPKKNAKKKHT